MVRRDGQHSLGHRQVNGAGPDEQPLDPLDQRWIELVGAVEHAGEELRYLGVSTHRGEAPGQLQRDFGPLLGTTRGLQRLPVRADGASSAVTASCTIGCMNDRPSPGASSSTRRSWSAAACARSRPSPATAAACRNGESGPSTATADRVSPLTGPGSGEEQDGERLDPSRQVEDEASGRWVDPVSVVEDEQRWAAVAEVRDQPVEAMQDRADAIARLARVRHDVEHRRGELCGPGEQRNLAVGDARPEKLSDGGERRLHRHLIAPRPQHLEAEPRTSLDTRVQQRRLPDPGWTLDQDEPTASESSSL